MESKTKTADVTVRASFALIEGAILAMSFPLFYFLMPEVVRGVPALFLFVIFPLLSFLLSLFLNWFLQYMYCGAVSVNGITMAAAMSPLTTEILVALAYFMPFLKNPVLQLLPELPQESPEEAIFVRDIWGYAFYLFWAGVYGQTIGSGMISACPS
jgi:hypothetical protein